MNDRQQLPPTPDQPRAPRGRGFAFQVAAVVLTVVSALAGTGLAKWLRNPQTPPAAQQAKAPGKLFPGRVLLDWKNPDLVLVFTGQMSGYLLPCGCSRPQVGGLERRYNLLQMIKDSGWEYVAADVGDIAQRTGLVGLPNQQGLIKYLYSMRALKLMDYSAVGFGENEVNLGLNTVLGEFALNEPKPRVLTSNLIDAEARFPGEQTKAWEMVPAQKSGINAGITAVTGTPVALRITDMTGGKARKESLRFELPQNALTRVLQEMAAKQVHLPILLFHGPLSSNDGKKPYTEAMACAEAFPQFPILVTLCDTDDPPASPIEVTTKSGSKSLLINVGRKGKYVGVVGVWKTGNAQQPFQFRYERVEMSEDFMTPKEKEVGHPLVDLMEVYGKALKDKDFLRQYDQMSHQLQMLPKVPGVRNDVDVTFVGSEACKKCHEHAYDVWKKSPHSHAYETLVKATRPAYRQYDPECIVCHTVGFGYKSGFVDEPTTPKLKDVGCESCHGPSSVHVKNPRNTEWHKRINPWKYLPANKRKDATDQFCQKCHDTDNDVTWVHGGFDKKWPSIEHTTPGGAPADEK